MKKHIAIFSLAYHPFFGGAEVAIKEITDHLLGKIFSFTCFTFRFDEHWPREEGIGNARVIRVGRSFVAAGVTKNYYGHHIKKILGVFSLWLAAEKEHRHQPFSVIWAIMASYGGLAALFFKLCHPKIPLLLTLQEGDSESHILSRVSIFYPIWRLIFTKADRIQVISNYLADFARRHGAKCPIEVVPNGVNLEKFGAVNVRNVGSAERVKNNSNIQHRTSRTIITTSRLVLKNGVDILIRGFSELIQNFKLQTSNFKLVIIGDGPERAKLEKLAADLGISDCVEFVGHVSPEKIPYYLLHATIFVRASRSEGLGNSFLEAMAAGLPVIGTPVGGIPDFLKDGETGLFCKVESPTDLAQKIHQLVNNPILANRLAENGQKMVREKYSWTDISKKMENIFRILLSSTSHIPSPHILIATGVYPPEIGGPATYTSFLEKELPKLGYLVKPLPFRSVRQWPPVFRHILFFLICLWRGRNSKLIYAQDTVSVGAPAALAAAILRKPFWLRVPGDYAWEQSVQRFGVKDGIDEFQNKLYDWRTEILRKIQRWTTNRAALVITPSEYFRRLVSGWVKNPEKVIRIYNGIDLEISNFQHLTSDTLPKVILSAGRLVPWKGFDFLIETMKDLPDWQLIIVGDGPERKNLESRIKNLELRDRVKLTGAVPREELARLLNESGIFILNTSFESFSFQLVEAMNAGVSVIATKIGNLEEIVEDGKEGILVTPNDREEILEAVKRISEDDDFRSRIIVAAKEKAKQFSIQRTVEKLVGRLEMLDNH